MKIIENVFTQPDSKTILDTEQCKIEMFKIAEDLSTATITIAGKSEYSFTARSGILTVNVGAGTISTPKEAFELNLFQKIGLERNDRVTIKNTQTIPLILNFISAN